MSAGSDASAARPPGARDARLRRRDRPRGARHPARAPRRRLRVRDLRRDRGSAARGPDHRLPRHGRRSRARRPADPPFLDRIARVADRLRAARADGARLPQHHAAGVFRRRPQGAGQALLPRTPRADGVHRPLRPRARRLRIQPPGARARSASRAPACCRSSPTSRTSTSRRDRCVAADFDDEWTNILFVGRVIPNKKFEDVIRAFHAYRTRHNPRSRLLLVGSLRRLRDATWRCCRRSSRRLGTPDVHFLGHVIERGADRALRRRRPLPLRQRARGLLRAAHRGVLQAACRCSPTRPRRCPATMDGGGVLYDDEGSARGRRG